MGILSRILGLAEGEDGARRRGGISASRPSSGLASDGGGHRASPRDEDGEVDDPLALDTIEAAMEARESPQARAARRKIMDALDDEQQCKKLVGAMRRIMREGGDA